MKKQSKNASDTLLNNDRFVASMLSNIETARYFFQFVLPTKVSELLDFETLQNERTRLTSPAGKDRFGDFFFTCSLRDPSKKDVRRPLFAIILEHKSQDEEEVAIQLMGYIAGLIQQMWSNRDKYADEDGKLPAPYAIVISQDWGNKHICSLKELLRAIPGFEDTIPNFSFQYFRLCDTPLEEIEKCEALTALFVYLLRLMNDKTKDVDQETIALANRLRKCLKISDRSSRIREGLRACLHYYSIIYRHRPQTPRIEKVIEKMSAIDFTINDVALAQECFPSLYTKLEKTIERLKRRGDKEAEARKKEAEARKKEARARIEAEEKHVVALKTIFARHLTQLYPSEDCGRIISLINSLNDYATLNQVGDICMIESKSLVEKTKSVECFLKKKGLLN